MAIYQTCGTPAGRCQFGGHRPAPYPHRQPGFCQPPITGSSFVVQRRSSILLPVKRLMETNVPDAWLPHPNKPDIYLYAPFHFSLKGRPFIRAFPRFSERKDHVRMAKSDVPPIWGKNQAI